tara:strand:+ start:767 stop:1057 length:291 start_codon:yes stop_codon:yes gene_type:complete
MSSSKQPSQSSQGPKKSNSFNKNQNTKSSNSPIENKSTDRELLLKLPGGFEYRLPGKRQRVFLGSLVLGLNIILLIAVGIYFYNPSFQHFIYNLGR